MRPQHNGVGIACTVGAFSAFSCADALVKWLSADYTVIQLVFLEMAVAAPGLLAYAVGVSGLRGLKPRYPALAFLRSALLTGCTLSVLWAISMIPLAEVYSILFAAPILVTVLAGPLLGESVGGRRWLAVGLGFVGILIILRPGFQQIDVPHLAALAAALLFALSVIVLRRVPAGESSSALLASVVGCHLLVTAPLLPGVWRNMDMLDLGLAAIAGLLVAIAHLLLVLGFRAAPAAVVAPFHYVQILWAVLFGITVFGDLPDVGMLVGAALVIAAGVLILRLESARATAR